MGHRLVTISTSSASWAWISTSRPLSYWTSSATIALFSTSSLASTKIITSSDLFNSRPSSWALSHKGVTSSSSSAEGGTNSTRCCKGVDYLLATKKQKSLAKKSPTKIIKINKTTTLGSILEGIFLSLIFWVIAKPSFSSFWPLQSGHFELILFLYGEGDSLSIWMDF